MNKIEIARREIVKKKDWDDFEGFEDNVDLLKTKLNLLIMKNENKTTIYIILLHEEILMMNILIELKKEEYRFDLEIIGEILYHM